jgi:glycosyltransferase involved in cell wall biosynthesis
MGLGGACQSIGTALAVITGVAWPVLAIRFALGGRRLASLGRVEPLPDVQLPSLTVIVAAKDEEGRMEQAARSLLAQDYPGLTVSVVDDRSTDATADILRRLAAEDPRLTVTRIDELPSGWTGKSHALAGAAARATTEWLLFTDGDVDLAPGACRRAVSLAARDGRDHIAVGPDLEVETLGEAIFIAYFVIMFHVSQEPWKAQDPRSRGSIGIGAFNLVRRDLYERAGGHGAIRFELIDDLALGRLLKRRGARQAFALPAGLVGVRWHIGVRGLVRGVEKNAFAAVGYRVAPALLAVVAQLTIAVMPVLGLFLPGWLPKVEALLAWGGAVLAYFVASRSVRVRPWQVVFMPLGGILFSYAFLRSTLLTLARGGVVWRGTFYSLGELRERQDR